MGVWVKSIFNPVVAMLWLAYRLVSFRPPSSQLKISGNELAVLVVIGVVTKGICAAIVAESPELRMAMVLSSLVGYALPLVFLISIADKALVGLVLVVDFTFALIALLIGVVLPGVSLYAGYRIGETVGVAASFVILGLYVWWQIQQRRSQK